MWRWLAMAAVAVVAVVLAAFLSGGDGDQPPRAGADKATSETTPGSAKARSSRSLPPPPRRFKGSRDGGVVSGPPLMRESAAFEAQGRDDEWADSMEDEVEQTIAKLLRSARGSDEAAVTAREIECRTKSCRIIVGGAEPDAVRQFLESLQDERGFYERADSLALERRGGKRNEQPTEIGVFIKFLR